MGPIHNGFRVVKDSDETFTATVQDLRLISIYLKNPIFAQNIRND